MLSACGQSSSGVGASALPGTGAGSTDGGTRAPTSALQGTSVAKNPVFGPLIPLQSFAPHGKTNVSLPKHVQDWIGYNAYSGGVNQSVSPSWFNANATYVEGGCDYRECAYFQNNYKAITTQLAIYVDPTYVYFCPSNGARGTECENGVDWSDTLPESSYIHPWDNPNGARLLKPNVYQGKSAPGEVLNAGDPSLVSAIVAFERGQISSVPNTTMFFSDDSGSSFAYDDENCNNGLGPCAWNHPIAPPYTKATDPACLGLDGGDVDPNPNASPNPTCPGSVNGYPYAYGAEIQTDSQWQSAEDNLLQNHVKPTIVNGSDIYTFLPAYGGAFLHGNVVGQNLEGCFSQSPFGNYQLDDKYGVWLLEARALFATTHLCHKREMCMAENGTATDQAAPSARIYQYASWLITYDPTYSVMAPETTNFKNYTGWPEYQMVPYASAPAEPSTYSKDGMLFERDFSQCDYQGHNIGSCSAFVNTDSTHNETLPSNLLYELTLPDKDESWPQGAGVAFRQVLNPPVVLAPRTAAIMAQK